MDRSSTDPPVWDALSPEAARRLLAALESPGPLEPGQAATLPRIEGYTILSQLGRGGAGEVYLALNGAMEHPVALKLMRDRLGETAGARRVWRELDILAMLRLPAIPRLLAHGLHEGRIFLVTEFIDGQPIDSHCEERGLDRHERVRLLAETADAVHALHEHGVIHRDIKPSNVLIDEQGRPALIDLGIASLAQAAPQDTITRAGLPLGTLAYMAPEQARGERDAVSIRSDVYGLGAMGYRLLTGQTPHDCNVTLTEALRRITSEAARDPRELEPSLPRPLAAILRRCVEADPARRYPSAAALAADLRRWLRREPVEAGEPSLLQRVLRVVARHPFVVVAAGSVLIAALIVGSAVAGVWWANRRPANTEMDHDGSWAVLRSYSGHILYEWPASEAGRIRIADMARRPEQMGGKQVVVLGRSPLRGFNPDSQLYLYDPDHPDEPFWSSGTGPPDIRMPKPISRVEGELFNLAWACTLDAFPELPGLEILAVHGHPVSSPNLVRIYDLGGQILYQVWHDGALHMGLWIPESRMLVLAGLNSENDWEGRGFTEAEHDRYPRVVMALRPRPGQVLDAWIHTPGGLGTVEPLWYQCLLPRDDVTQLARHALDLYVQRRDDYDPRGSDSSFLVVARLGGQPLIDFEIDDQGRTLRVEPLGIYRRDQASLGLPDPAVFYFGDLPPLLVDPLNPPAEPAGAGN